MKCKRTCAVLAVALIAVFAAGTLSLGATSDSQVITGNPEETQSIVAPADISNWTLVVGAQGTNTDVDDDEDNTVVCQSNVLYDVTVNSDLAGNKTSANMFEYETGGTPGYVESGRNLQYAMRCRTGAEDYTAISDTPVEVPGMHALPVTENGGDTTYVDFEQQIGYNDDRLAGTLVYRIELTFTISPST